MTSRPEAQATAWGRGLAVVAVCTALASLSASQLYFSMLSEHENPSLARVIAQEIPAWYFWALVTPVIAYLTRRFPPGPGQWARALAVHLPAALVITLAHIGLQVWVGRHLATVGARTAPVLAWFRGYLFSRLQFELIIYAAVVGVVLALDYQRRYRDREAQLARARLQALKMQLHPHFLFNTLQTVSVLTAEDPAGARRTLSLLGDLLREALDTADTQEVPVRQELASMERYLEIEQTRFADRLVVETTVAPDAYGALVPHLILQPLVENAIRYAIAPRSAPGRIVVSARRDGPMLELMVADDGPGLAPEAREGVGLTLTRERLRTWGGPGQEVRLSPRPSGGLAVTLRFRYRTTGEPDAIGG